MNRLFNSGELFLGLILLIFSIFFPIAKFVILYIQYFTLKRNEKLHNILLYTGKWSMLDVYILAILIVVMKLRHGIYQIKMEIGTVFFSLSIIISIILSLKSKGIEFEKYPNE
jgi:paraquat-inducible protein A